MELDCRDNSTVKKTCIRNNPENGHSKSKEVFQEPAGGSTLHPLLDIDHITANIISYLDLEDLKSASQVCSTWLQHVNKFVLKTKRFSFSTKTALEFVNCEETTYSISSGAYGNSIRLRLDLLHYDSSCAHENRGGKITWDATESLLKILSEKNIKVADLRLQLCPSELQKGWQLLCSLSASLIDLSINFQCDSHFSHSGTLQDEWETTFPNLKSLSGNFKCLSWLLPESPRNIFRELVTNSSNIENFNCKKLGSGCEQILFDMLSNDRSILRNLKYFSFATLNDEEFQILSSTNIKLKSLSFVLYSGFRVRSMYQFLTNQASFLESLTIDFENLPTAIESFACGVDLVNLKNLSLRKFCGSIHFVSFMEKLESLTLRDVNLSVALHDEASKHNYRSGLKSLKIFGGKGSTGRFLFPAVYSHVVTFFPEIEELRMEYFTNSTLRIIIEGLPNLRELDIPNGVYTDEIFSVPEVEEHNLTCEFKTDQLQSDEKAQNLSGLKKLRKLVLQSPRITDAGVCSGLLKCRELRNISIDSPLISDASLQLLCRNPDIRHLEFVNCYQLTPNGISEAKLEWGTGKKLIVRN